MNCTISAVKPITQLIREELDKKRWNASTLAEKVDPKTTPQNMNRKLSKETLDVDWLVRISKAMEHDFFADLSKEFVTESKREKFNVENVVEEPAGVYVVDGKLAAAMRQIAQDEIKKSKK